MDHDEVRGALPVSIPRPSPRDLGGNQEPLGVRLPLLTARPGNVGIQIDAFRAMKLFHRPRCGKFTAQFQGVTFENHSMENHSRVVERTQLRARIVAERLQKLKDHEAKIVADEERRCQRRREREIAEQRRLWLARQAVKKAEQVEREQCAALVIQRVARGVAARQRVERLRQERKAHEAARCLQVSMKSFIRKKSIARRRQEREKERHLRAAVVIQRQARKRQASSRRLTALDTVDGEIDAVAVEEQEVCECGESTPVSPLELDSKHLGPVATPALDSEPSLDLLFSASNSPESEATVASPVVLTPVRPRRPVTIKRVGGGFRHASFQSPRLRSSRPPELADAIAPKPQPPQHHQPRVPRGRTYAPSKHLRSVDQTASSLSLTTDMATTDTQLAPPTAAFDSDTIETENALLELVEQRDFEEALSEPISDMTGCD